MIQKSISWLSIINPTRNIKLNANFLFPDLQEPPTTLKRSNSDPNLADSDDMLKRKQIAMTFPVSILEIIPNQFHNVHFL